MVGSGAERRGVAERRRRGERNREAKRRFLVGSGGVVQCANLSLSRILPIIEVI
jgi:hypothetical protein